MERPLSSAQGDTLQSVYVNGRNRFARPPRGRGWAARERTARTGSLRRPAASKLCPTRGPLPRASGRTLRAAARPSVSQECAARFSGQVAAGELRASRAPPLCRSATGGKAQSGSKKLNGPGAAGEPRKAVSRGPIECGQVGAAGRRWARSPSCRRDPRDSSVQPRGARHCRSAAGWLPRSPAAPNWHRVRIELARVGRNRPPTRQGCRANKSHSRLGGRRRSTKAAKGAGRPVVVWPMAC